MKMKLLPYTGIIPVTYGAQEFHEKSGTTSFSSFVSKQWGTGRDEDISQSQYRFSEPQNDTVETAYSCYEIAEADTPINLLTELIRSVVPLYRKNGEQLVIESEILKKCFFSSNMQARAIALSGHHGLLTDGRYNWFPCLQKGTYDIYNVGTAKRLTWEKVPGFKLRWLGLVLKGNVWYSWASDCCFQSPDFDFTTAKRFGERIFLPLGYPDDLKVFNVKMPAWDSAFNNHEMVQFSELESIYREKIEQWGIDNKYESLNIVDCAAEAQNKKRVVHFQERGSGFAIRCSEIGSLTISEREVGSTDEVLYYSGEWLTNGNLHLGAIG